MKIRYIAVLTVLAMAGCKKEDPCDENVSRQQIREYLEANQLQAEEEDTGLFYIIDEPGNDTLAMLEDRVQVKYKGYRLDGTVFEELDTPAVLNVFESLEGLRQGLPKFGEGGKGTLIFPCDLAFGNESPDPIIPAGSALAFDIELQEVLTDREYILQYLEDNDLEAQEDPSGLFYHIEEPGSQEKPTQNSIVDVFYKGYLVGGQVFDQTIAVPANFPLQGVIEGWQIGIPKFGRGGKGTLFIPPTLGYGLNPPPGSGIPANAVLIFEIELVDFQ